MASKMYDGNLYMAAGLNPPAKYSVCEEKSISNQTELKKVLRILDEQDAVNRFVWTGIPMNLSSQEIERMLYYKGQLAFFKLNDDYYLMPYCLDGSIDFYGRYNSVHMLPFTSGTEKEDKNLIRLLSLTKRKCQYKIVLPEEKKESMEDEYCVLLKDYTNQLPQVNIPRQQLNDPILEEMSYLIPYMDTSLMLGTGVEGMRITDADQKTDVLEANKSLKKAALTQNAYVPIVGSIDFQELAKGPTQKAQDYLLVMQSLDNFRLSTYGLENGGLFEKTQHILESENAVNGSRVKRVMQDSLQQRQLFCNIVNSIFGFNMWCEPAEVLDNVEAEQVMQGTIKDSGTVPGSTVSETEGESDND